MRRGTSGRLGDVLTEIGEAMARMGSAERLSLASALFDKRAVTSALKLAGTAGQFDRLAAAIDHAGGAAKRTAEQMDSGLGGVWRRMMSALEGVQIAIGEALSKPLSELGERITEYAGAVTAWIGRNQAAVQTAMKLAAGLGTLGAALMAIGGVARIAAVGIGLATTALSGMKAVATAMAAHPVIAFFTALAAVVATYVAVADRYLTQVDQLSDAAQRFAAAQNRLRAAHEDQLQKLEALSKKQRLTNAEMELAEKAIASLQSYYGDLGLSINKTTGALEGYAGALAKVRERQRKMRVIEVEAQIAELQGNMEIAQANARSWWSSIKDAFNPDYNTSNEVYYKNEAEKYQRKIIALRKELSALKNPQAAAAAPGEVAAAEGTAAGAQSTIKPTPEALADVQGRIRQMQIAAIDDELKRAMAQAQFEYQQAFRPEYDDATINALILERDTKVAMARREHARKLAEEQRQAAERQAEDERRAAEEVARYEEQLAYETAAARIALIEDETERRLAMIDLEQRRAEAEARRIGADVAAVGERFDLERRGVEAAAGATEARQRASTAGTFYGLAAAGLGSGSAADRTARATEETAKNTRKLLTEARNHPVFT